MKYETQRLVMGFIVVAALIATALGMANWGIVLMLLAIVVKPDPRPTPPNPVYVVKQGEEKPN